MKVSYSVVLGLVLSVAVVGCSPVKVQSGGVKAPGTAKSGAFLKKAKAEVEGKPAVLAKDKRLAIPFFQITFVKFAKSVESASPLFSSSSNNVKVRADSTLVGVEENMFQQLTNEAYDDLVQKLTAVGYEVVPKDEVLATRAYGEIGDSHPKISKKNSVYMQDGGKYPSLLKIGIATGKLAYDTKAALLNVEYAVNHTSFKGESKAFLDSLSAKMELGQAAHVGGKISMNSFANGKCNEMHGGSCYGKFDNITLGQAPYSEIAFGEFEDHTSKALAATETAIKGLSILTGGSIQTTKQYELHADPQKYHDAALDALKQANDRFVKSLAGASQVLAN